MHSTCFGPLVTSVALHTSLRKRKQWSRLRLVFLPGYILKMYHIVDYSIPSQRLDYLLFLLSFGPRVSLSSKEGSYESSWLKERAD